MDLIKEFENWLLFKVKKNGVTLSASSAYKYARAIKTISDDMIEIGLLDRKFFVNNSIQELRSDIQRIKSNDFFIRKNNSGHNMYSVALEHYLCFFQER